MGHNDRPSERTDHLFLFIGGVHRSGTTLLYKMIGEHPDIDIIRNTDVPRNEGQYFQNLFPIGHLGGPGRFGFREEAYRTEETVKQPTQDRSQLMNDWRPFFDQQYTYWCEKTPQNIVRSRYYQELLPDSRFLFIVRHPVPVTMATMKWSDTSLFSLMHHWQICHNQLLTDLEHLENATVVYYENLVNDPCTVLEKIFEWLSITLPEKQKLTNVAKEISRRYNSKYVQTWINYRSGHHKNHAGNFARPIVGLLMEFFEKFTVHDKENKIYDISNEISDIEAYFSKKISKFGYRFPQNPEPIQVHDSAFDPWRVSDL